VSDGFTTAKLFTAADIAKIRTMPVDAFEALLETALKDLLTRRQWTLYQKLEAGYVFELQRSDRAARRYLMRPPNATETDGAYINARTINYLIELGLAIKVTLPWSNRTLIYSRSRYEKSPMGQASGVFAFSKRDSTTTSSNSTPTSSP